MKLRTLADLEDAVERETAWRKRELISLLLDARAAKPKRQPLHIRAGVALLYAHWEGWLKAVAEDYVTFVGQKKLKYSQLSAPLFALAMRGRLNSLQQAGAIAPHLSFVRFIRDELETTAVLNPKGVVQTHSNLSSSVLHELIVRLGLPYAPYELSEKLIDESLVRARNEIAHGQFAACELAEFESIHREVLRMMETFTTDIVNAATLTAYKS